MRRPKSYKSHKMMVQIEIPISFMAWDINAKRVAGTFTGLAIHFMKRFAGELEDAFDGYVLPYSHGKWRVTGKLRR